MIRLSLFVFLSIFLDCLSASEREMTVVINAKERECFYEHVEANHIIDIEYQVIDGGHGDLDINFELSVDGRIIFVDYKKSDNVHRYEQAHPAGNYKFCFDNTISSFNRKTVFFELLTEDPDSPMTDDHASISDLEGFSPEEFFEMKVQDFLDVVHVVRTHLTKARQVQDMLRSFEARDRNLAELNCSRVGIFSTIIVLTMICVGLLQVFMIKSLFETNNTEGRKIWNKLNHIMK